MKVRASSVERARQQPGHKCRPYLATSLRLQPGQQAPILPCHTTDTSQATSADAALPQPTDTSQAAKVDAGLVTTNRKPGPSTIQQNGQVSQESITQRIFAKHVYPKPLFFRGNSGNIFKSLSPLDFVLGTVREQRGNSGNKIAKKENFIFV